MYERIQRYDYREYKIRKNLIRRRKQLRRRLIAATLSAFIIFATGIGMTTIMSRAQESRTTEPVKLYTTITVEYGSNASEIAKTFINYEHYDSIDEYIDEIEFINHIDANNIIAGTNLIIPYYN